MTESAVRMASIGPLASGEWSFLNHAAFHTMEIWNNFGPCRYPVGLSGGKSAMAERRFASSGADIFPRQARGRRVAGRSPTLGPPTGRRSSSPARSSLRPGGDQLLTDYRLANFQAETEAYCRSAPRAGSRGQATRPPRRPARRAIQRKLLVASAKAPGSRTGKSASASFARARQDRRGAFRFASAASPAPAFR